jgi:hypothetical protein
MQVRYSRLLAVLCILFAAMFGFLAFLSPNVSFTGILAPVAFLAFGIAFFTRPYLIIEENAVIARALIGPARETYPLVATDAIEFEGKQVFLVDKDGRRRLRGVTGWLANRGDWSAFRAWAEKHQAARN